jgi:hypothetical protein
MIRLVKELRFSARTKYPFGTRPQVTIAGQSHKLADFSENGIKIITDSGDGINIGTKLRGVIHFNASGYISFAGEVVRTVGDLVAIKLEDGIPHSYHEAERQNIEKIIKKPA